MPGCVKVWLCKGLGIKSTFELYYPRAQSDYSYWMQFWLDRYFSIGNAITLLKAKLQKIRDPKYCLEYTENDIYKGQT